MTSELSSTARPTGLRLAGFASLALGAVIAGVGAARAWAAVGFAADVEHELDVPWHGIDVWEGKVVLFAAVAALLVMLAMRISGSGATRTGLAIALVVLGALCIALPAMDAVRAEDRFGGAEGTERLARTIAAETELPQEVVREELSELLERDLRVEIGSGLWLTAFGGVLLVVGGVLSLVWVRRESTTATRTVPID